MAPRILPDQAYLIQCFRYDPETGALMWRARPETHFYSVRGHNFWNRRFAGAHAGSVNSHGNVRGRDRIMVGLNGTIWLAHRLIWKMQTGHDIPQIDHCNGDATDNRWSNLRPATDAENAQNKRHRKGRMLPKGAHVSKKGYQSEIRANGIRIHLGRFETAEEAAAAYTEAAAIYHGEFANAGKHQK